MDIPGRHQLAKGQVDHATPKPGGVSPAINRWQSGPCGPAVLAPSRTANKYPPTELEALCFEPLKAAGAFLAHAKFPFGSCAYERLCPTLSRRNHGHSEHATGLATYTCHLFYATYTYQRDFWGNWKNWPPENPFAAF